MNWPALLDYLAVVAIYVARITAGVAAFLASGPVWRGLKICWVNRHLPLSSLVPLLRPFDLRRLLTGIAFGLSGKIFGATAFIMLDARYLTPGGRLPFDGSVAVTWSLWAASAVWIAAAFADRPRAIYRGTLVFVIGGMLLAAISGRFG